MADERAHGGVVIERDRSLAGEQQRDRQACDRYSASAEQAEGAAFIGLAVAFLVIRTLGLRRLQRGKSITPDARGRMLATTASVPVLLVFGVFVLIRGH